MPAPPQKKPSLPASNPLNKGDGLPLLHLAYVYMANRFDAGMATFAAEMHSGLPSGSSRHVKSIGFAPAGRCSCS